MLRIGEQSMEINSVVANKENYLKGVQDIPSRSKTFSTIKNSSVYRIEGEDLI